jgi:hypothetical protein
MRLSWVMWAALTVVVGISLFLLKYQVQSLEDQLQATYVQIEKDKSTIRVLEAEWTYLNDPARLRRLSEQHLGFSAPTAKQVATLAQLPYRDGYVPNAEGVSSPVPPIPEALPLPGVRTAMVAPVSYIDSPDAQPRATFVTAAAPQRPSTIEATFARLQRLIPPTWSGASSIQEPLR